MLPEHYHPRNKILSHRTLEPAPRPRRAPCKVMDTTSCNPHPLARNHLTGNRDARTAARYFLPRPRSPKKRRYFASGEESHSDGGQLAGGGRRITRGQAGGQWAAEETTPRAVESLSESSSASSGSSRPLALSLFLGLQGIAGSDVGRRCLLPDPWS